MLGDIGLRLDELKGKFGEDWSTSLWVPEQAPRDPQEMGCRRGDQDGRKNEGKGFAPDVSQGLTGQDEGPARH